MANTLSRLIFFVLVLSAALTLTHCSSRSSDAGSLGDKLAKMNLSVGEPVNSILNYRVESWQYIDRHRLILEASRRKYYLITFRSPCLALQGKLTIGFTATGSSLSKFDKIVVDDASFGRETCQINEIISLEAKADPTQKRNQNATKDPQPH